MYDSVGISQAKGSGWLLLIHQIPPKPDYFRVKVRRRLQQIGAVALKNSVYVLPNGDETMEDFQWLRRMVVEEGGEATVCIATFVEGLTDDDVKALFRERSNADYGEIISTARDIEGEPGVADVTRLKRRLEQAEALDFYDANRRLEAQAAIRSLEESSRSPREASGINGHSVPRAAIWVTRTGVQVDRIASAWLIRRFIDREARFKFVAPQGYTPQPGELRFDMFEGEFTHEGDRCTFEVLASRFAPDDPSLRAIGEIVHDVDCKDEKFGRHEATGIASVIRGIAAARSDDNERLKAGESVFEGLYSAFEQGS